MKFNHHFEQQRIELDSYRVKAKRKSIKALLLACSVALLYYNVIFTSPQSAGLKKKTTRNVSSDSLSDREHRMTRSIPNSIIDGTTQAVLKNITSDKSSDSSLSSTLHTSPVTTIIKSVEKNIQLNTTSTFEKDRVLAEDRQLSISYGDGTCKWQPPEYDVPDDINFDKTLIAGFPSGDKRLTFIQMEALTGWSAKDEWDFEYLGMSNHPFIKANYPHHEGIWGWGDVADQVIMVVRNIRRSMVEYHDILWDIGYAKTWVDALEEIPNLFSQRPPLDDFLVWRDERVMDEIHWYGWFIDYYMEDGLLRDIYTHQITTQEHWNMLMQPTAYSRDDVAYDLIVGDESDVTETYDPHCVNDVTDGCHPQKVISAELLVEPGSGPEESRKIAEVLANQPDMSNYVIDESAWECIWEELIINKKGLKTFLDRDGLEEIDYNFGEEMLQEMIHELNRLIYKYNAPHWISKETSQDLVALLTVHREMINDELDEIQSGVRKLNQYDFLGPKERKKRKIRKMTEDLGIQDESVLEEEDERMLRDGSVNKDYSQYFNSLHRHLLQRRVEAHREEVMENERLRQRNLAEMKRHLVTPPQG